MDRILHDIIFQLVLKYNTVRLDDFLKMRDTDLMISMYASYLGQSYAGWI